MFLLFSYVLDFFWGYHFLHFLCSKIVGKHESTFCPYMSNHCRNFFSDAVNNFMMSKYFRLLFIFLSKCFYKYYLNALLVFVDFLWNLFEHTFFFNGLFFMIIIFCLQFLWFLKFVFLPRYRKCFIVPSVSYDTWNSLSVTFFANELDYAINKEWW